MKKKEEFYWKWLGKLEFVPGAPARDLSSQEVEKRGIQNLVEKSPLYKKVSVEEPKKKESK